MLGGYDLNLVNYTAEFKDAMKNWKLPTSKEYYHKVEDPERIKKVEREIKNKLISNDVVVAIYIHDVARVYTLILKVAHINIYDPSEILRERLEFCEYPTYYGEGIHYTILSWINKNRQSTKLRVIKGRPLKLEEWFNRLKNKSFW